MNNFGNIFELAVFCVFISLSRLLAHINRNPEESKVFGPNIDWIDFWESNINFFRSVELSLNLFIGFLIWNLAKDSGVMLALLVAMAYGLILYRLLMHYGGGEDEDSPIAVFQSGRVGILECYSGAMIWLQAAIITATVVHMLFVGFLN